MAGGKVIIDQLDEWDEAADGRKAVKTSNRKWRSLDCRVVRNSPIIKTRKHARGKGVNFTPSDNPNRLRVGERYLQNSQLICKRYYGRNKRAQTEHLLC